MNYKDKFVGIRLYGYCGGLFGRDSYHDKRIIASGETWVVTINNFNEVEFASFIEANTLDDFVTEYSSEKE